MGERPWRDEWREQHAARSVFLAVLALAGLTAGGWWWVANDPGPSAGGAARAADAATGSTDRRYGFVPESGVPVFRIYPNASGVDPGPADLPGLGVDPGSGEVLRREVGELGQGPMVWKLSVRPGPAHILRYACDGPVASRLILADGDGYDERLTATCDGQSTAVLFDPVGTDVTLTVQRDPGRGRVEFRWELIETA